MMYMEDDDFLTWEALLSWADDEAELGALGFTRSFVRIETSPETGALGFATRLACTPLPDRGKHGSRGTLVAGSPHSRGASCRSISQDVAAV